MPSDAEWASWQLEIIRYTEKLHTYHHQSSSNDHEAEILSLREEFRHVDAQLRESRSQRAVLESVISERLKSELEALSEAEKIREGLLTATARVQELERELVAEKQRRVDIESKSKETSRQLADVESFMVSETGSYVLRLEAELAATKLALAELEQDKDELEQEVARSEVALRNKTKTPLASHNVLTTTHAAVGRKAASPFDGKENGRVLALTY